ncbi:MAG: hypothetical protein SGJ20_14745 [Planctomycetota bacterium]|nr:hypothetical protein [Planctomycetota bacterium]
MLSLFDLMFNVFIWGMALGLCVLLYGYGMAHAMYATAMRQVLEEREHQRQLELMEMTLELERVRYGTVSNPTGPDRDGADSSAATGEAIEQASEEIEGTTGYPATAMVTEQPIHVEGPA